MAMKAFWYVINFIGTSSYLNLRKRRSFIESYKDFTSVAV
jgi:hypothetical protein